MILSFLPQFCLFYTKVAIFFPEQEKEERREAHELLTTIVSWTNKHFITYQR